MMAEMVMVLNHNIRRYYEIDRNLAETYDRCWMDADIYCLDQYKGEDLDWYIGFVD